MQEMASRLGIIGEYEGLFFSLRATHFIFSIKWPLLLIMLLLLAQCSIIEPIILVRVQVNELDSKKHMELS